MIEINLLPPGLRKKESRFQLEIPKESLFVFAGAIIAFLVFIHVILVGALITKKFQMVSLTKAWQRILPEKKKIDAIKNESKDIVEKIKSIDKLTKKGRVSWAKKLNRLSDVLPQGAWLRGLEFSANVLKIEGSAISLKGEEVIIVNRFASALKNNSDFYSDFSDLDVDSINRRQIKNTEVADFILSVKLKTQ